MSTFMRELEDAAESILRNPQYSLEATYRIDDVTLNALELMSECAEYSAPYFREDSDVSDTLLYVANLGRSEQWHDVSDVRRYACILLIDMVAATVAEHEREQAIDAELRDMLDGS